MFVALVLALRLTDLEHSLLQINAAAKNDAIIQNYAAEDALEAAAFAQAKKQETSGQGASVQGSCTATAKIYIETSIKVVEQLFCTKLKGLREKKDASIEMINDCGVR